MDRMPKIWSAKVLLVLLVVLTLPNFAFGLERNSFVRKETPTIEAFRKHVATDPIVMDRYMRHFGMTREQVTEYFATLRPARIEKNGSYLVYNVPAKTGILRHSMMNFKKGDLVWADAAGTYVLKASCGNPMIRGTEPGYVGMPVVMDTPTDLRAMDVTDEGQELVALVPSPEPPLVPEASPVLLEPPLADESSAVALAAGGGGLNLAPLAALALAGTRIRGSSGGDTPVVPEPGTMIALGFGAASLVIGARKRKQK